MFIIDSIIGNTDRHNGNWGFLINKNTKTAIFSPIYDCGSSLNQMLEEEEIESIDNTVLKNLAINCYSCLKEKGKKINYMSYISEMTNKDCNDALIRVFNKINLDEINDFIDGIKCINDKRKKFYKDIIKIRYDIVKKVYVKLKKEEFK